MITAVNYHLWEPCNMRCKFCFATFKDVKQAILPKGHLPEEDAIRVVEELARLGFKKITFAGGEPTLCNWLSRLIQTAKSYGLTTMIVTNGTGLSDDFLTKNRAYLDWIALSVDSVNKVTNEDSGRAIVGKKALSLDDYKNIVDKIKAYGYGLKINTVVHAKNHEEDLTEFLQYANPIRWKVFQVLPIVGQNDGKVDEFILTKKQFDNFNSRHEHLQHEGIKIVIENNDAMKGSYAMVDPAGRFYDNAKGKHNYSKPILSVGAEIAIQQVDYSTEKFKNRGGEYDWTKPMAMPSKITLSGEVASGKSSVGKLLANELGYDFLSIGEMTREIADSRGMTIVEFQAECKKNPKLNEEIDQLFLKKCQTKEGVIIDYRLGFHFVKDAYHVFLNISEEKAIERLRENKRINETHATVRERNDLFKDQFTQTYDLDYTCLSHYNSVVDVNYIEDPFEVVLSIINSLKAA
jgi:radical S-adenosyl methionine domain-containing protein 2